jgi:hypothetical protein
MTNWDAFDTPRLWAMVSGEGSLATWEQVAAWDEVAGAVEQHRARLVAARSSLVSAWPPDRNEPAEAFVRKLDDLIARVGAAQRDASATAAGLATIVDALGRAKAEIEPLYSTYHRVTSDWVPGWLDHAEHELDQRARMHMAAAEAAVEQITLPVPASYPAVHSADPDRPDRASGSAAWPLGGDQGSPPHSAVTGAGAGSAEQGPASAGPEPSSPILASARPGPDLVPGRLPRASHGVPPAAPSEATSGSPPTDLPSPLPCAAPSGSPPPALVGPGSGLGAFRGYTGNGPVGSWPGFVGSGSVWTGVRGSGVPGLSVPGPGVLAPGAMPGFGPSPGTSPIPGSSPLSHGPAPGTSEGPAAANAIGGYAGGARPGIRPRPGGTRAPEPADGLRTDQPRDSPARDPESPWITAVGVDPVITPPPPAPRHDPGPVLLGRRG